MSNDAVQRIQSAWTSGGVAIVLLATFVGCARNVDRVPSGQDKATTSASDTSAFEDTSAFKNQVPATTWFSDTTSNAGIDFVHQRGPTRYWLPEIMCGGAAWLDYDGDGDLDLYLIQAGDLARERSASTTVPGNVLYRNNGNGTFEDVTSQAGLGDRHYGSGVAVGDYDADGDDDVYVTNVGPNVLFENQGDGTFRDVTTRAGVGDDQWGTSAAFVDFDNDGLLDLFVVNYIRWAPDREIDCRNGDNRRDYCAPQSYRAPAPDLLYRNRGDGGFENVSVQAGLNKTYGNGLGVAVGDFNADGRIDLFVANDGTPNQLWIQQRRGVFEDRGLLSGCSVNCTGTAEAGMGVAAVDIENDGDLDLFMTHLGAETNTLYVNQKGFFDDRTAVAGLAGPSVSFTGFGLGFSDFDHDGQLDLYVANGRVGLNLPAIVPSDGFAEPNQLFRGLGQGRFTEIMPREGSQPATIDNSRAAAFADCDQDGDTDLLIVNNGGAARLLINRIGARRPWIRFRVLNRRGVDAVGAMVRIETADTKQYRVVGRAYSYQSSNEPDVHFGLADEEEIHQVTVIWPDGSSEEFGGFDACQTIVLRQGFADSAPPKGV